MYLLLQVLKKGFISVFNPGDQLLASAVQATAWVVVRGQVGPSFWCSWLAGCDAQSYDALLPLTGLCLQLCLEKLSAALLARLCRQMCMRPFLHRFMSLSSVRQLMTIFTVPVQVWLTHQARSQPSAVNVGSVLGCWPAALNAQQPWRLEAASFVQAFQLPSAALQVCDYLAGRLCLDRALTAVSSYACFVWCI